MFAMILGILPSFLLNAFSSYLKATTTVAIEGEKTKRQVTLETIQGVVEIRKAQAETIQAGMQHKAFWVPWLMAAIPATTWYAWGMIDSTWPGILPHISALPPQLKEYTDTIWQNLFLSGGVVAGATAIAKGLVSRK